MNTDSLQAFIDLIEFEQINFDELFDLRAKGKGRTDVYLMDALLGKIVIASGKILNWFITKKSSNYQESVIKVAKQYSDQNRLYNVKDDNTPNFFCSLIKSLTDQTAKETLLNIDFMRNNTLYFIAKKDMLSEFKMLIKNKKWQKILIPQKAENEEYNPLLNIIKLNGEILKYLMTDKENKYFQLLSNYAKDNGFWLNDPYQVYFDLVNKDSLDEFSSLIQLEQSGFDGVFRLIPKGKERRAYLIDSLLGLIINKSGKIFKWFATKENEKSYNQAVIKVAKEYSDRNRLYKLKLTKWDKDDTETQNFFASLINSITDQTDKESLLNIGFGKNNTLYFLAKKAMLNASIKSDELKVKLLTEPFDDEGFKVKDGRKTTTINEEQFKKTNALNNIAVMRCQTKKNVMGAKRSWYELINENELPDLLQSLFNELKDLSTQNKLELLLQCDILARLEVSECDYGCKEKCKQIIKDFIDCDKNKQQLLTKLNRDTINTKWFMPEEWKKDAQKVHEETFKKYKSLFYENGQEQKSDNNDMKKDEIEYGEFFYSAYKYREINTMKDILDFTKSDKDKCQLLLHKGTNKRTFEEICRNIDVEMIKCIVLNTTNVAIDEKLKVLQECKAVEGVIDGFKNKIKEIQQMKRKRNKSKNNWEDVTAFKFLLRFINRDKKYIAKILDGDGLNPLVMQFKCKHGIDNINPILLKNIFEEIKDNELIKIGVGNLVEKDFIVGQTNKNEQLYSLLKKYKVFD